MVVKNMQAATLLLLSFYTFPVCGFTLAKQNGLFRPRSILSRLPPMTTEVSAVNDNDNDENDELESEIDAFLRGDYNHPFAPDAPAPHPGLSPRATIEAVLMALHHVNQPAPSHGAAVLQRFCAPLSRAEKWGGAPVVAVDAWKHVLRGALTPTMLARRLRASAFSILLDWTSVDVTDGYSMSEKDLIGVPSLAFVNAALFFGNGVEPCLVQFTLRRFSGVWLIDTARLSNKELFEASNNETSTSS